MSLPALVLTAGLGTRLDPITRLLAKPAVPLGDRSLIERVLAWLHGQGVHDLVLNLHHRPASLTAIVADGAHLGLSVRYSWEQPVLGSAGGPRRALPLLASDTFLIVNGDTLCDVDLAPMIAAHRASGADVTLAVVPNAAPHHYNGIAADEAGVVTGFVPKGHAAEGTWHLIGVQVVEARAFASLEDGVPAETVAGLYRTMVAETPGRVRVYRADTMFLDVGTPRDYLNAALRFSSGSPSGNIHPSARVTRSAVWPSASVAHDVVLEDAIVAGPVRVPAGTRLQSVVVVPSSVVSASDGATVRGDMAIFPLDRESTRG